MYSIYINYEYVGKRNTLPGAMYLVNERAERLNSGETITVDIQGKFDNIVVSMNVRKSCA